MELINAEARACAEIVQTGGTAVKVSECVGVGLVAIVTCITEFFNMFLKNSRVPIF